MLWEGAGEATAGIALQGQLIQTFIFRATGSIPQGSLAPAQCPSLASSLARLARSALPRQNVPDREVRALPAWWARSSLIAPFHGLLHGIAALGHSVVLALSTTNLRVQFLGIDVKEAARRLVKNTLQRPAERVGVDHWCRSLGSTSPSTPQNP